MNTKRYVWSISSSFHKILLIWFYTKMSDEEEEEVKELEVEAIIGFDGEYLLHCCAVLKMAKMLTFCT